MDRGLLTLLAYIICLGLVMPHYLLVSVVDLVTRTILLYTVLNHDLFKHNRSYSNYGSFTRLHSALVPKIVPEICIVPTWFVHVAARPRPADLPSYGDASATAARAIPVWDAVALHIASSQCPNKSRKSAVWKIKSSAIGRSRDRPASMQSSAHHTMIINT